MIATHTRRWPNAGRGPYRLEIHLALLEGRVECVGFLIGHLVGWPPDEKARRHHTEPVAVPASLLRDLKLGDLIDKAIELRKPDLEDWAGTDPADFLEGYKDLPAKATRILEGIEARGDRRGRKGHPPQHYAEVAQVYTEAYQLRQPPTKAVQEKWTVSKTTAAKWVAKCRELEMLPPTQRGKASA